MTMKDVYYYIDEAGTLESLFSEKDRFFVITCCITDSPENIRSSLNELKMTIEDDPYFAPQLKKFKNDGFHATVNHFDIRARYYSKLHSLNFRAYSVVIDKSFSQFKDLLYRGRAYYDVLYVLLYKRILSNRQLRNVMIFEEYGSKPYNHLEKIKQIIEEICQKIERDHDVYPTVEIYVHDKTDIVLSIVDYMNYVLFQMLLPKPPEKMVENFSLIEPKIGLLNSFFAKKFFSETNRINFDDIKLGQK
jgi:hypothetical protein